MLYESSVHWWPLAAILILGIEGLGGGGRGRHVCGRVFGGDGGKVDIGDGIDLEILPYSPIF